MVGAFLLCLVVGFEGGSKRKFALSVIKRFTRSWSGGGENDVRLIRFPLFFARKSHRNGQRPDAFFCQQDKLETSFFGGEAGDGRTVGWRSSNASGEGSNCQRQYIRYYTRSAKMVSLSPMILLFRVFIFKRTTLRYQGGFR